MIHATLIQFIITLTGGVSLLAISTQAAISFGIGGVAVGFNFLMLGTAWSLIFQKKLIALAISLIVFKYAILGLIIYQLGQALKVDLLWFAMGIASFIVSAVTYILVTTKSRP